MKFRNIFLSVVFNSIIKESNGRRILDNWYRQMFQFIDIPVQAFIKNIYLLWILIKIKIPLKNQ